MIERMIEYGVFVHQLPLRDALKTLQDPGFVRIVRIDLESYHKTRKYALPFEKWITEIINNQSDSFAQKGQDPFTNVALRIMMAVEADCQNYPDAVDNMLENKRRETPLLGSGQWSDPKISLPSRS